MRRAEGKYLADFFCPVSGTICCVAKHQYIIYNDPMIVTTRTPYTKEQIAQLKERFGVYIKTVIDLRRRVCSAGCDRHFESEATLLEQGSAQEDIWGGGVDLETNEIDCVSFINIRPTQQNTSNEIQDPTVRAEYERLTRYFFQAVL